MKSILRQDGYTLLLTLILIVLLFLVTASFTVASMSQSKQIVKTDNNFVSTSYAEMGIEFSKNSYQKTFNEIQTDLYNKSIRNETWTTAQFETEILNSKKDLLKSFLNSLYENFNKTSEPTELKIYNFTRAEFDKVSSSNFINNGNFNSYISSNQFTIQSLGVTEETNKSIDITFNLPSDLGVTRTNQQGTITNTTILDKYFREYCIVEEKCVESRPKGNSGNDSITNNIYSETIIEIAKIQNFTSPAYELFARDELEFKANQTRLNNFTIISENIYFNFPAAASGKLQIKDSILIANKLKFHAGINSRDVELIGTTKVCFLSPPSTTELEKLQWPNDITNYIVLNSTNLAQFKQQCNIEIDLSVSSNKHITTKIDITNLSGKIKYQ